MSLPPPPGYCIASVTLQRSGTPKVAVITMGLGNPTAKTAAQVNTDWRLSLTNGANRPLFAGNFITGWTILQTYVVACSAGGVITTHTDFVTAAGTRVAAGMPVNTSVVILKTVAIAGRQYRGQIKCPPIYFASSVVDQDGQIQPAQVSAWQTMWTAVHADMVARNIPPYMLHQPPQSGPTPAPTAISGFTVRARVGTMRRRIRR